MLACIMGLVCAMALASPPAPTEGMRLPKHGVYVVAHRGAHDGIPENTLAAYRKAIDLGCDFVEVDLRATKDGHIVSVHNATVDAYTQDAKGPVSSFTLEELRALDIGSRVGPEWRDERIPTFEEILELCQGKIGIYLDLKQAPVEPILELIRKYGMERDVLWYAGAPVLKRVRELCPECILMPDPGPERLLPLVLKQFEPRVVASVWRNYSEDFAKTCHAAGAIVIVDEDTPDCWDDLLAWKTGGIQTDHPGKLIAYLKARMNGDAP